MGATNATTNYGLPLFIETDKPGWLTDWNTTMTKLDQVIKSVEDQDIDVTQEIQDLQDTVGKPAGTDPDTDPSTGIFADLDTLQAAINHTAANTATNTSNITKNTTEINALDSRVESLEEGGSNITFLPTTNTSPAVNALNQYLTTINLAPGTYLLMIGVYGSAMEGYTGSDQPSFRVDLRKNDIPIVTDKHPWMPGESNNINSSIIAEITVSASDTLTLTFSSESINHLSTGSTVGVIAQGIAIKRS